MTLAIALEKMFQQGWWFVAEKFGCNYSIKWGPYLNEKDADAFMVERKNLLEQAICATGPYVYSQVTINPGWSTYG